jgi:hypothetical protein
MNFAGPTTKNGGQGPLLLNPGGAHQLRDELDGRLLQGLGFQHLTQARLDGVVLGNTRGACLLDAQDDLLAVPQHRLGTDGPARQPLRGKTALSVAYGLCNKAAEIRHRLQHFGAARSQINLLYPLFQSINQRYNIKAVD